MLLRRRREEQIAKEEEEKEEEKRTKPRPRTRTRTLRMIALLHWEYPLYCIITALYIPILSGAVLIFTGLRIRATLRRRHDVQIRLHQNSTRTSDNTDGEQLAARPSIARRCNSVSSRRILKIITCTSVAYFVSWSPYTFVVLGQSFVASFNPPSGVQFAAMWLANANSAVNVFIYSATNKQFRRECVLLASRLCCSRLSSCSSTESHPNVSPPPPVINLSTINVTPLDITC